MTRLRIVVLGYLVRGPIGGMAWHHLNYVAGLRDLGHDVLFVEDSDEYPSCYDPTSHQVTANPAYGLAFAASAFDRIGLADAWAYFDWHQRTWHGPAADGAADFCRASDVVLNVSGVNPLREWTSSAPCRVFIDTDPVFTQIRHLREPASLELARAHTDHFTFGENVADADCAIPDDGLPWKPTRQPIALSEWATVPAPPSGPYTTVMQWASYAAAAHAGRRFGMKSDSFSAVAALPPRTSVDLEIALGGTTAPRDQLTSLGWSLCDPLVVARGPWDYQEYIARSRGEFSVAKHGYVEAVSGWFSERSACFLASGRPVVVEDTGFGRSLPTGGGIHGFTEIAEAKEALERVDADHDACAADARNIAEEHFDARRVLGRLIDLAG